MTLRTAGPKRGQVKVAFSRPDAEHANRRLLQESSPSMNRKNLVPLVAVSRSASLLFISALSLIFLASTTVESLAQSSGGRPVARLVTASRPAGEQPQMQHRVYARTASVMASPGAAAVAANSFERQAFNMINAERARYNLSPLAWDGQLCRVARGHSENMGRRNFFDHEAPDGSNLPDRVNAGGVVWRSLGENIAYNQGQVDPVRVAVAQWLQSPQHRANILRAKYTHTAVGVARTADGRVYLTQIFLMR